MLMHRDTLKKNPLDGLNELIHGTDGKPRRKLSLDNADKRKFRRYPSLQ